MNPYMSASFSSFSDFIKRFADMFKGPGFISAFRKIDPIFREKLMITVSMANNCGG